MNDRKAFEESWKANALRAELEKMDDMDEQTIADMLEGETNLHEAIQEIDLAILDAESDVAGADHIITKLADRRDRAERRADRLRGVVMRAMDIAGLKTVKTPAGTYTVRQTKPKVVVEDESLIPTEYFKTPDPVLNKKALNEAIAEGAIVPGTRLSNGGISLTIRRA